jgi:hypothetical protein
MHAYLEPSQRLLELINIHADGRPVWQGADEVERMARHGLATIGSASGISYSDSDGTFLYVVRNKQGSFDTKFVDRRADRPRTMWTRRNARDEVIATEEDPTDKFDPRTRPWYVGAVQAGVPFWTDTYHFFTLDEPGISLAIPHKGPDGKVRTVVAIDIELTTLCTFLKHLAIGTTGRAYIIDRAGRIVAFPDARWVVQNADDVHAQRLDELGDPVLTQVYERLRVEGFGRKVLDVGNRRIIVSAEPVKMLAGRDWLVLIVVPEADFIGFVSRSGVVAALMSLVVAAIVIALAAFLVWRSAQAGRRVAAATLRQRTLETNTSAIVELARDVTGGGSASLRNVTEIAASACAARRVSVWRLSRDGRTLECEDYYDRAAKDHVVGLIVHREELPLLFATLEKGAVIDLRRGVARKPDAERLLHQLQPLGVENAYVVPIVLDGRPLGLLAVEEPAAGEQSAAMAAFCDVLASLLALRFAGPATAPPELVVPLAEDVEPRGAAAENPVAARRARLERSLLVHDVVLKDLEQKGAAQAAVGVLKLPEWATVAQTPAGSTAATAMDEILREVIGAVELSGVGYAALLDDQLLLATSAADEASLPSAAFAIAALVVDLRDRLMRLEERWGVNLDFRLAIDVGAVMTSTVGSDPPVRTLWGGAVGVARILAAYGAPHTIAASETACALLSAHFVMRPRGTFFLPEAGNMRTFAMVGRA